MLTFNFTVLAITRLEHKKLLSCLTKHSRMGNSRYFTVRGTNGCSDKPGLVHRVTFDRVVLF